MSAANIESQFRDLYISFFKREPEQLLEDLIFNEYNGPNLDEVREYLSFIRGTFDEILMTSELHRLGAQSISELMNAFQGAVNAYSALNNNRDQTSFQQFGLQLDAFIGKTYEKGVPVLAGGSAQLATQRLQISSELANVKQQVAEVERMKEDVRTLITPAVAGSLSKAFTDRRDRVFVGRVAWLVACLILGVFAIYTTHDFVRIVTEAAKVPNTTGSNGATGQSLWMTFAIRTAVLIPVFAAFGFAFAQYRKERDYEEEYAHKAAVAASLPNYGDLARDHKVRDQIVTAASTVIFNSPSEQARKAQSNHEVLGSLKEIVESLTKAVGNK